MEQKLREPAFISAWDYFDLRSQPESPGIYPSSTWGNFFFDAANRGNEKFESTVTKYSAYLDPPVLLHVHALQVSEFFRMRLRDIPVLVSANDHMPKYFVSMAFKGPQEQEPYQRFIDKLVVLAKELPRAERE